MTDLSHLYRDDFLAWTRDQAEALRGSAALSSPAGTNRRLDWENLAEEIESLGISQRTALSSQIRRILHHFLKLEFSPADPPRNGWRRSVREARVEALANLRNNPSLRPEVDDIVRSEQPQAVTLAAGDLEDHGEANPAIRERIAARTYTQAQVFSDWMPERSGDR